jgi:hypothetical protein
MANIRLSWVLPTQRVDGKALAASDIAFTRIFMRVQGAPSFTALSDVPSPESSLLIGDLDAGTYDFEAMVFDRQVPAKSSAAASASATVFAAAPQAVSAFTATVE